MWWSLGANQGQKEIWVYIAVKKGLTFDSPFEGAVPYDRKSQQQDNEAAALIAYAVRKQRNEDCYLLTFSFLLSVHTSPWDGAADTLSKYSHLNLLNLEPTL